VRITTRRSSSDHNRRYARWELRACARHGHETFRPADHEELAGRLHAGTPAGEAWRCLRCGAFVVGPPRRTAPARDAPIVLRHRALRDSVILRALAVERGLRAVVLFAVAYAINRFRQSQGSLQRLFDQDLPAFRQLGTTLHIDVDSTAVVHTLRHLLTVRGSTLTEVAVLVAAYGLIEGVEAVGLWLLKRWAEYFTAVATAAFIPLEVHELLNNATITKVLALIVNIGAVIYLVISKHLFGARGGRAAYEADREEMSLLEVEEAATGPQHATLASGENARAPASEAHYRPSNAGGLGDRSA
jgi:uncharacterized membrane protein (DUF2068 family)